MSSDKRVIRSPSNPSMEWCIDFLSPEYQGRLHHRTRKKDALSRAVGLNKKADLRILDMSAGLGKDAYWLAYCGASVTLLERHPVLAQALAEAVASLREDPKEYEIGQRMKVIHTDAVSFIETLKPDEFDVAYYDPMFLPRRKSALVKKDMQIMHELLGADKTDNVLPVFHKISLLVVKRAKADPSYLNIKPDSIIESGLIRYERYKSIG